MYAECSMLSTYVLVLVLRSPALRACKPGVQANPEYQTVPSIHLLLNLNTSSSTNKIW